MTLALTTTSNLIGRPLLYGLWHTWLHCQLKAHHVKLPRDKDVYQHANHFHRSPLPIDMNRNFSAWNNTQHISGIRIPRQPNWRTQEFLHAEASFKRDDE